MKTEIVYSSFKLDKEYFIMAELVNQAAHRRLTSLYV